MRAIVYDRFGPVDVLHQADIAEPQAGKGQVLVSVRATSINVIDSRVRSGMMGPLVNKKFPKVPGSDLAGVVRAAGAGVTGFRPGDQVFGAADPLKGGVLTETVALPAGQLAPMPRELSFEEAAALPVTGLAALYALRDLGQVRPGQDVLIHGASGAMGLFAVQIAKVMGARVTAVAGTSGLAAVEGFGADVVIDYKKRDATRFERPFDVIVNCSGKLPYALARASLKPAGRLIEPSPTIPVFIGSMLANPFRRKKHLVLTTVPRRKDLEYLAGLVRKKQLKPTIAKVLPMAQAAEGFVLMERGGVVGKVIITI